MRHSSLTAWAQSSRDSRWTAVSLVLVVGVVVVAVVALLLDAGAPPLLQLLKCNCVELISSGTFLPLGDSLQVIAAWHLRHSPSLEEIFQPRATISSRLRYSRKLPA